LLLAIDIGNTNIVLGLLDGDRLDQQWRLATHHHYTSDECAATLRSLFDLAGVDRAQVSHAIISCVVPPLLPIFERTCLKSFDLTPLVVGPGMRTGMPIAVDNPPEVGADRIVNAVAAYERLGAPVIAIDFGTAITFDCVSAAGEFVGGLILPGLLVSLDALIDRASKLASVELVKPPAVIGKNTTHMLQSGMIYGYAGLVDMTVERIREELGREARVIATGGLAHLIAAETKSIERVDPFLTLDGLRILFDRNHGQVSRSAGGVDAPGGID
jgi:type III pantothenate kinase